MNHELLDHVKSDICERKLGKNQSDKCVGLKGIIARVLNYCDIIIDKCPIKHILRGGHLAKVLDAPALL